MPKNIDIKPRVSEIWQTWSHDVRETALNVSIGAAGVELGVVAISAVEHSELATSNLAVALGATAVGLLAAKLK